MKKYSIPLQFKSGRHTHLKSWLSVSDTRRRFFDLYVSRYSWMLSNETHSRYSTHTTPSLYQVGTLTSASEHLSTASCQLSTLQSTYTQVILSESSCWLGSRSKEIVLLRITRPVLISEKNNVILSLHFYGFLHFSRYLMTWCMASELHVYHQARPRNSSCYRSFKQLLHLCLRFLLHHTFLFISFHFRR